VDREINQGITYFEEETHLKWLPWASCVPVMEVKINQRKKKLKSSLFFFISHIFYRFYQGAWIARISQAIQIAIQLAKQWPGNLDCNPDR